MKCDVCRGACCEIPLTNEVRNHPTIRLLDRVWLDLRDATKGACIKLSSTGRCEIYDSRPMPCRIFPPGGTDCIRVLREIRTPAEYALIRDTSDPVRIHKEGVQ